MEEDYYEYSDKLADELRERLDELYDKFEKEESFKMLSEVQQEEASFIIQSFGDYMFSYHGELEKDWSPEEVVSCCTETLQRKVSAEEEYYASIVPVLDRFFEFLGKLNILSNPKELRDCLKSVEKQVVENAKDPSYWGMAKSMFMGAQAQGYDIFDDEEREEYIEKYNQSLDIPKIEPYIAPEKIGRNDPCICGSGKKYKKCCMNKE